MFHCCSASFSPSFLRKAKYNFRWNRIHISNNHKLLPGKRILAWTCLSVRRWREKNGYFLCLDFRNNRTSGPDHWRFLRVEKTWMSFILCIWMTKKKTLVNRIEYTNFSVRTISDNVALFFCCFVLRKQERAIDWKRKSFGIIQVKCAST